MKKGTVVIALLTLGLATAWAGEPAPTHEDNPQAVGQVATGTFSLVPTISARPQSTPLAAAPLDDGSISATLGAGGADSRGTDYYVAPPPTGNDGNDGLTPGTAWATIQHAVQTAADGGIVHVAAGTYTEVGQIVITKALAIIGDQADRPVIKPAQDTGGAGDARGWWLVNAGKALALQYLVLDGDAPTRKVHTGIRSWGTVEVRDCLLKNNVYPGYDGRGIGPYAGAANVIQHVTFQNMGRIGALIFGSGVYATIDQCTYTGKGDGDWLDYGFELGGGGGATISNCTITGCTGVASDGSTSAGLLITTYFGAGTAGTVLGNVLTGNSTAIAAGYDAADTSTVVAHYNDISGCTYGVQNTSSTVTVNAEKNWWGTTDAATIATKVDGGVDYTPYLLSSKIRAAFAGNRLAALQNADGGWGWPLTGGSQLNTVGPIAMGLARAYEVTSDPTMYTALQKAGTFLLAKTNNFSPSDGYLAAELDRVFGGTTYVTHLNNNFYGPLAAGTYNRNGAGTLYTTTSYVNLIRTTRASQGIPNLAAWDVAMGLVAAARCGVSGSELDAWIAGVEGEINELDGDLEYDVLGLAGALYGLAFVHEEFDPTAGEHAAASNLADLADLLASYQIDASGGFAWNSNYVTPYEYNETVQETAYAILALAAVGGHDAEVQAAGNWLLGFQLATGGWMNYVGSPSGENNEVSAEGAWGVWQMEAEQLTLQANKACYNIGETVTVEIWMNDISQNVVGGQFFLQYDPAKLDFQSAIPGPAPFDNQMYESVDEDAGTIDYSVNADYGDPGVSGDAKMAVLTFQALTEICSDFGVIAWRPHSPPSRLSNNQGQAIYPELVNLEVLDAVPPVLVGCPSDTTVECDAVPAAADVTATDNCDPAPVVAYGQVRTDGSCPDNYILTRTWTATDHCGNSSSCTQVITVQDTTDPVLAGCPADATVECDDVPPAADVTATDNCDPAPVIAYSEIRTDGSCADSYALTRTWTATDRCGNSNSCTQLITVQDTTDPVLAGCPADVTVECNAVPAAATVTATDNCDPAPVVAYSQVRTDGSCPDSYTLTRTWTATDRCDNSSSCTQVITVQDTTAPTITACPDDIAVAADAGQCTASVTFGGAAAADNCDPAPAISYWIGGTEITSPYTFSGGVTTVTVKAKDACGNENTSCSFTVTVSAYNELTISVELSPTMMAGPITRCITFELWNCDTDEVETVSQELTFTSGLASDVSVLVACAKGPFTCITARDALHTLRRTAAVVDAGTYYVANFTGDPASGGDRLIGGNLNDDYWIDILDFGVFSWQYTANPTPGANTACSTPYPHADVNGSGTVDLADFTFIQINFLKGHEANCCGQPGFREDSGPITRISVADLVAQDLGELAAGDINGDGWLDEQDMAEFAAGLPPQAALGDLNCDGAVDFGDINPFILALTDPAAWQQAYPGCNWLNADINGDGNVDFGDINLFVALLSGS